MVDTNDFAKINPINTVNFTITADPEDVNSIDQTYVIGRFTFIKSLMILEELGKLADKIDIGAIFSGNDGFRVDMLIEKLPELLTKMRPTVVTISSLILMKNKDFEQLADDEEALSTALRKLRPAVYNLDVNQFSELLQIGIERIGIQDIKKNFPTLLAALRA